MFIRLFLLSLCTIISGCALIDTIVSDDPMAGLVGELREKEPNSDSNKQIVNGRDVPFSDKMHKYAVLLTVERQGKTTSCTAVPITKTVLLTAAHCVYGSKPSAVKAFFDSAHTFALDYKTHENYEGTPQSKSDLAVVKLHSPLVNGYEPMALYDGSSERANDDVMLLGFGITDEKKSDGLTLRTTSKSFKNDVYIKEGLMGFNQKNKTGGFCRGDSGAPIYVTSGGKPKIIGINSFVVGTEKDRECHTASFAMYVPHFRSWILSQAVSL